MGQSNLSNNVIYNCQENNNDAWDCSNLVQTPAEKIVMKALVGNSGDPSIHVGTSDPSIDNCIIENEGNTYIESNEQTSSPSSPIRSEPYLINNTNNFFHHNISFETKYNKETESYYLDIETIFNYITLGKRFPIEYYDFVSNYVCKIVHGCTTDELANSSKCFEEVYSFNGRKFNKVIVMYNLGQFNIVSHSLLTWAIQNPEKIS